MDDDERERHPSTEETDQLSRSKKKMKRSINGGELHDDAIVDTEMEDPAKWALKGDFSLIDIGCDYYVTRFTNPEDYTYVMTQGPWMLSDNFLQGHKEEVCPTSQHSHEEPSKLHEAQNAQQESTTQSKNPEEVTTYGRWMMVKKPARRKNARSQGQTGRNTTTQQEPNRTV
ncbi:hypothetical protein Cgig2_026673 [Carnegiea gigantea]|uniref:DUF4283 domain-containing protein n=1 Tax=Carnegiea gigantea TaxID=171969 RepID=A0A9Q1Q9H0_9CARY|nr:hypothetical protein Cgig2_026673 [Carnegiea gigantea]